MPTYISARLSERISVALSRAPWVDCIVLSSVISRSGFFSGPITLRKSFNTSDFHEYFQQANLQSIVIGKAYSVDSGLTWSSTLLDVLYAIVEWGGSKESLCQDDQDEFAGAAGLPVTIPV